MPTWSWHDVQAALTQKGFIEDRKTKHEFHVFTTGGKITGIKTKLSHGSKGELSSSSPLFGLIRQQLKLQTNRQLADLLDCPLDAEGYTMILRGQGYLRSPGTS